ncbi:hypothetical protein Tco_0358062 [Tanacetum coccineum]
MQSSVDRFFWRSVPPSRNNRRSSNHGKGRKEQNGANGVCYNKMPIVVQRHNRKERNEEPWSAGKGASSVKGDTVASR